MIRPTALVSPKAQLANDVSVGSFKVVHDDAVIQQWLAEHGIATAIHYPVPPHLQACYPDYANSHLPLAALLANEVLSLPMSPAMTQEQVNRVVQTVNAWAG